MGDLVKDVAWALWSSALAIGAAILVLEVIGWLVAPMRRQWDKERLR